MFKKILVFMLLCVAAGALLIAGGQEEAAVEDSMEPVVYYLWDDPTYQSIVETFNAAGTGVTVDPKYVPAGDYEAKLATLLAGGARMDAYMQKRQSDMFAQYANGYVAELDGLVDKHGYDIDGVKGYMDAISIDGKVVAIPFRGAGYYIYYNRKMFEEAGEALPESYIENGEWTWAKYEEVARRLSTGDGEKYGSLWYTWGICQPPLALQHGTTFINAEGEIDVNEHVWNSFKLRKELEEDGIIPKLVDLKVTKTHYSQAFYEGNVGMLIIGEWFPGYMIKAREDNLLKGFSWEDWGITRLPYDGAEYAKYGNPTFNHVHAKSKNQDAAFQFIGWMGGAEGAEVVAKNGFLPPMVTPGVMDALSTSVPDQQSLEYLVESVPTLPTFYNKYGSRIDQFLGRFMEVYLTSEMSDAEMKAEFIAGLEEIRATTD